MRPYYHQGGPGQELNQIILALLSQKSHYTRIPRDSATPMERGNNKTKSKNMNTQNANLHSAFNQWANRPQDERFQSLEELLAVTKSRRMRSRSAEVMTEKIAATFDAENGLLINGAIDPARPSHWSFGQLCSSLRAPAAFLREVCVDNPELVLANLNHCKAKAPEGNQLKWLTVEPENDGPATLQAVTSPTYGRIWDADVVECVMRVRDRSNGKWHNPPAWARAGQLGGATVPGGLYASDRDVFAFMIDGGSYLEGADGKQLNRGFIVENSEVGKSTFKMTTFLFRGCCGNHIIWGARDVTQICIRHTSGGPARFDSDAMPALQAYADKSVVEDQAALNRAFTFALPAKREDVLKLVNKAAKFSGREIEAGFTCAKLEEGKCENVWELVQGLTAHARTFDFVDARVDLETRAGKLIDLAQAVALPA